MITKFIFYNTTRDELGNIQTQGFHHETKIQHDKVIRHINLKDSMRDINLDYVIQYVFFKSSPECGVDGLHFLDDITLEIPKEKIKSNQMVEIYDMNDQGKTIDREVYYSIA
jgi:hypothetical protein